MSTRRDFHAATVLGLLAAAGLLPTAAQAYDQSAFDAKTLGDMLKALGAGAPKESGEVSVSGPDIAENGAVVPVTVATSLGGVKRLLLAVEKNPNLLTAVFECNEQLESNFATRVKMGQSSNVFAIALMADGRVLYAQKEIKVTLGGCGG